MGACPSAFGRNKSNRHRKKDAITDHDSTYATVKEYIERRLSLKVQFDDDVDQHSAENYYVPYTGYNNNREFQRNGSEHGTNWSIPSNDCTIGDTYSPSYPSSDSNKNDISCTNRNTITTPNCRNSWVDPPKNIQQMVEAYRPLLEGSIKAREVIPFLPFIVDDREALLIEDRDPPRAAMSRLLDHIAQSEEKGKWTTFLDALKAVGYMYIVNLLTDKTEGDSTNQIRLLRILAPEIIRRMDTTEFLDHLYQDDVIGEMDKEEIECEKRNRGQMAANLMLIDLMPRRLENWCHVFISTMRKCGMADVAEEFESAVAIEIGDKLDNTRSKETGTKTVYPDYATDDVGENLYIHPGNGDATAVKCLDTYSNPPPYIQASTDARNTVESGPSSCIASLMAQEAVLHKQLNEMKMKKQWERKVDYLTRKINNFTTESAESSREEHRITDTYDSQSDTVTETCTLQELRRELKDMREEIYKLKIHKAKGPITHVQSDSSDNYTITDRPIAHQRHLRHEEYGIGSGWLFYTGRK